MATLRTFAARIPWINSENRYPRKTRLVLDEVSELCERPGMQNCSLLSPSRDPVSDAAQFFQRDSPSSAFSIGNNLLGYDVIHIGREAVLTTGQIPEFATAPPSPLALKFGSETPTPVANSFYGFTAVGSAIRIRCDFGNPQVDAKPFIRFLQTRLFHIAGDSQIPLTAMIDKVGLALTLLELFDLAKAGHVGNILTPAQCPNVDVRLFAKAQYSIVIGNGPRLPKHPLSYFVEFVGVCNFGKYAHCELGIEFELLSGGVVERLLESEVGKDSDLPSFGAEPVRTSVSPMKSREQ